MAPQVIWRSTPEKQYTYEDFWNLPIGVRDRYELIKGDIYRTLDFSIDHIYSLQELLYYLRKCAWATGQYRTFSGIALRFSDYHTIVEPDIMLLREGLHPVLENASPHEDFYDHFFQDIPDLIVEITSLETYHTDHVVKWQLYERAGIQEYWIVNPRTFSVTVWVLVEGQYQLHGEFVEEEVITSTIMEGLAIRTRDLFRYYSSRESQIAER